MINDLVFRTLSHNGVLIRVIVIKFYLLGTLLYNVNQLSYYYKNPSFH